MARRVGVMFSGGKDSTFVAHVAVFQGNEVVLLTVRPENEYSDMYHYPNLWLTELQASLMDLEHVFILGEKRTELFEVLNRNSIDALYTGAIESDYQRWFFQGVCKELGIPCYAPLWRKNNEYADELMKHFECVFVRVSAEGMEKELLGKPIGSFRGKKGIHRFFEGGEAETLVLDAPLFSKRLSIKRSEVVSSGLSHTLVVRDVDVIQK